jgi:protease I
MADLTGEKILMVVPPKNFRDEELKKPMGIFTRSGAEVTIASKGVSQAKGMFGATVRVDKDLAEVSAEDYSAIIFVGGGGAEVYFNDSRAHELATKAVKTGKIVGAICIAPSILANAGLLEGIRVTSFVSEKDNLIEKGANYTGAAVERDGRIITGRGPEAAEEFGNEVASAIEWKRR